MTAPARSTTPAVTDRRRPLRADWSLYAVVLVIGLTLVVAAVHLRTRDPDPLVVSDGRTVELTNLGDATTGALLDRVAAQIGPAVLAVERFWGTDWAHDIRIVGTGSADQFAAQAGAADRSDTAAVTVADTVDPGTHSVSGQRMVLAPGATEMSTAALRIVLGHELFHYAARADTAVDAPRWITEGVADYVARPAPALPVRVDTATLPADADFTGDAARLSAAYDRAWLFARFLAERYGSAALRTFYLRVAGVPGVDENTALRELFHTEPAEMLTGWRQWAAGR